MPKKVLRWRTIKPRKDVYIHVAVTPGKGPRGGSPETIRGYIKVVRTLGCDGKAYQELTEEDLMAWQERISSNGWSAETVNWHRRKVKHFLRWTHGCRSIKDPTPQPIRCIQQRRVKRKLPKVILSRGEVRKLIDACDNQRDRGLMFFGYETGGRDGEILGTKIGDIEFDQFGAIARLSGKTGDRRIRLVECVPDLKLWLSMHPDRSNPGAPMWPRLRKGPGGLGRDGLEILVRKIGERARLNKHVYPYLLRHTRATHLAKVFTESQMREFFGWTKDSDMPSVYVHLSGRDCDSTLLKHYGIKVEALTEDLLAPKTCSWCQTINSPSAKFCQSCNAPLDPISASKAAEKQKRKNEMLWRLIEHMRQAPPEKPIGEVADDFLKRESKELEELVE